MTDHQTHEKRVEVDKPPRPRAPNEIAVVDQTGCSGCEVCIAFCPVDCIEVVPGPQFSDLLKLVEVDLDRCIGCKLCARHCPWETIDIWPFAEGVALAPRLTIRSLLYSYELEEMHEAAEGLAGLG
ncbi:MAG: ferredoxin family protein [Thermoanaerobaculia bacterium]